MNQESDRTHDYADRQRSRLAGLIMGFMIRIADHPDDNPQKHEAMHDLVGRHIERLQNERFATDQEAHATLMNFANNMANNHNGHFELEAVIGYLLSSAIRFADGQIEQSIDEQIMLSRLLKGAHAFIEQWSGKNRAPMHHAELTQIVWRSNYVKMFAEA